MGSFPKLFRYNRFSNLDCLRLVRSGSQVSEQALSMDCFLLRHQTVFVWRSTQRFAFLDCFFLRVLIESCRKVRSLPTNQTNRIFLDHLLSRERDSKISEEMLKWPTFVENLLVDIASVSCFGIYPVF